MKVEKQIRKVEKVVEVEEPVYILEMSELDVMRIRELIGSLSYHEFNKIINIPPKLEGDIWLKDSEWGSNLYSILNKILRQDQ